MAFKVKCEFIKGENCTSVITNDEAKEVRKISCSNDNEEACCYLCDRYQGCEISCNFLGENKSKSKNKLSNESIEDKKIRFLRCPLCDSKMLHSEVKLRTGGWSGLMQLIPFGSWGEVGEELIPVVLHVCPKCGKLEFTAPEKTKQNIISRS
jgi:hypothetical protein